MRTGADGRDAGQRLYHGTRAALRPTELIPPAPAATVDDGGMHPCVLLTPHLDEAIWEAEIAGGDGHGRVYVVEAMGQVVHVSERRLRRPAGHPSMSFCTEAVVRVAHEVTEWPLYHGTRADLRPGDLIMPGRAPNFGDRDRTPTWVYFTRTLDAATWGAELAEGDGPGRIYLVEPTGPFEDDPNLTDQKFRGNPTKSFRSRAPLRIMGELTGWPGHPPAAIAAMREGLARLARQGIEPLDD